MLESNRDKSKFIATLVLWWYQSNKSVVKLVSLFFSDPHLFRFSGFTKMILAKSSSTVVHWGDSKESSCRKVRNSRNVHRLRSERTNQRSVIEPPVRRGASPPPVSAGLGWVRAFHSGVGSFQRSGDATVVAVVATTMININTAAYGINSWSCSLKQSIVRKGMLLTHSSLHHRCHQWHHHHHQRLVSLSFWNNRWLGN